jgi:thiol-disulfide isomerase/thioredoxin
VDQQVLSLALNEPMSGQDFVWTAPQGVTVQVSPSVARAKKPEPLIGQQYPTLDLTVPFLDGRKTTVRKYLQGKKGALLWFWNTTCFSCMEEFPHMEQLYEVLRGRGIEIVVLDLLENEGDRARTYTTFHKATMPVVLSTAVTQTLEKMRSSFVVLDSTGTILYTSPRPKYLTFWRILNALADGTDPAHVIAQANAAEEEQ